MHLHEHVMPPALHSLSVYEAIVVHCNLNMMTKVTDFIPPQANYWHDSSKDNDKVFRTAWLENREATLVAEQRSKLPMS